MIGRQLFTTGTRNFRSFSLSSFAAVNSNASTLQAEVLNKEGVQFVNLPIPPNYTIKNFTLHEQMTFESIRDALKIEQNDVEIRFTNAETNQ